MMLVNQYENDYAGLVEFLEARFSGYLTPQPPDPPDGYPAEVYSFFPRFFGGSWPVLAAAELPPEPGSPASSESNMPFRTVRCGIRIYHPSLTRPNPEVDFEDGREAAKRVTRRVWTNWLNAFKSDDELHDLAFGTLEVVGVDMGDHDRIGNPFYQPGQEGRTILWVHATEVRVGL